ncbi:GNAT family N-acetyltransferase [Pseudomonadota bacterium]
MDIREFDFTSDLEGVRTCLIELQDYECGLDSRMPAGVEVVDPLFAEMMARCAAFNGRILVAAAGPEIAGYVTVLTRVESEDVEDGGLAYGLVTDLMVRETFRNQGVGRRLLEAAEAYAAGCGVRWLRVEVLAQNHGARGLYSSFGFSEHIVSLEKKLSSTGNRSRVQAGGSGRNPV